MKVLTNQHIKLNYYKYLIKTFLIKYIESSSKTSSLKIIIKNLLNLSMIYKF